MEKDSSINRWLGRLSPKTARDYDYTFKRFLVWLKENGGTFSDMSPDELIEYQVNADNGSRYKILDTIQEYVGAFDSRATTKTRTYAILKSFFMHNRAELPKDTSFRIRSDTPPVNGELTLKELRDIVTSSKEVYAAIFTSMFQGGMGVAEFEYWNLHGYEDLRKQLKNGGDIIKVDLPGRKHARNKRPFYTFIGGDAVEKIRVWLSKRPGDAEGIFTNQYGDPIRGNAVKLYWKRHLRKLGYVKPLRDGYSGNRYGKNLHEIRDLFRTQWEKSPAKASVAEFMMGHVVDALNYNKAYMDESWSRKEYEKALPMLEILSSSRPFGEIKEDEIREAVEKETGTLQAEMNEIKAQMQSMSAFLDVLMNKDLTSPENRDIGLKLLRTMSKDTKGS